MLNVEELSSCGNANFITLMVSKLMEKQMKAQTEKYSVYIIHNSVTANIKK